MPYLLLMLGLVLIVFAAWQLGDNSVLSFSRTLEAAEENSGTGELLTAAAVERAVAAGLQKQLQQWEVLRREQATGLPPRQPVPEEINRRWRQAEVGELAAAGLSATEIAAELGLGRGEVELILGWRKAKN